NVLRDLIGGQKPGHDPVLPHHQATDNLVAPVTGHRVTDVGLERSYLPALDVLRLCDHTENVGFGNAVLWRPRAVGLHIAAAAQTLVADDVAGGRGGLGHGNVVAHARAGD